MACKDPEAQWGVVVEGEERKGQHDVQHGRHFCALMVVKSMMLARSKCSAQMQM